MKIAKNMLGRLVQRFRLGRDEACPEKDQRSEAILNVRNRIDVPELEIIPTSAIDQMEQQLQQEIKSRERLERRLIKTNKKIDHLVTEFAAIQNQLFVDLDLEKRKNKELRTRLRNHPVRTGRTTRKN